MTIDRLDTLWREWQERFAAVLPRYEREALRNVTLLAADSGGHFKNFVTLYKQDTAQCHDQFHARWPPGQEPTDAAELVSFIQDLNTAQIADGMVKAAELLLRKICQGIDQWFWHTESAWLYLLVKQDVELRKAALVNEHIFTHRILGQDDEAARIRLVYVRSRLSLTRSKDLRAALLIAADNSRPQDRLWLELHTFLHTVPLALPLWDLMKLPGQAAGALRKHWLPHSKEDRTDDIEQAAMLHSVSPPPDNIAAFIDDESLRELCRQIVPTSGLTERQAELYYWNKVADKPYRLTEGELSVKYGLTVGTVRQHLARAKAKISLINSSHTAS